MPAPYVCGFHAGSTAIRMSLRPFALPMEGQVAALLVELALRVAGQPRPKALGQLSLVSLEAEICDWKRFYNRKQVGSYTGCLSGRTQQRGQASSRLY